jgi:glycine hydroxymethyltransferase
MRIGTAAISTRGMKEADMLKIVNLIDKVLTDHEDESVLSSVKKEVNDWMVSFPLYAK